MTDDRPAPVTLRELIDRAAEECPESIFLIDPSLDRTLTFGELRSCVHAVLSKVHERGLPPGAHVGVAMQNGMTAVVTDLGLMYGGYVAVPINLSVPEQIAYVVEHADIALIFASPDCVTPLEAVLANSPRIGVMVFDDGDLEAPAEATGTLAEVRGEDDALLMYTSGTTSRPKGVLASHRAMVARGLHDAVSQELRAEDRLLCVLPLYHMNAICAVLGVLYSHGSVVLPRQFGLAEYWDLAIRYRCTRLSVVPTILSQLVAWSQVDRAALGGIRYVRSSSMPLSSELHRAFEERFGLLLIEGMGMTEAGGIFLNPPSRERRKIGSLGVAPAFEVRIAGPDGSELPSGEVGEIWIRGPALMTGYHKDPEATRSAVDSEGWLHTGDFGSRDDEGYFYHRGRKKELIIKAGTNISPLVIDEALLSHPKVAEAAAVGIPDPYLGEDIAAFVVLKPGVKLEEEDLVSYAAARLGVFRSPRSVVVVDSFPRGPTGKVMRHELAARLPPRLGVSLDMEGPSAVSGVPRTALEDSIAAVWVQALRCDQVSTTANFFVLGGNSLLALQVLARLQEELGVQMSLSEFFECPTVAQQAARVEATRLRPVPAAPEDAKAVLLAPVRSGCAAPPLFCVYGLSTHRRLAECLGPEQPVYGVVVEREIDIVRGAGAPLSVEELARQYIVAVRRVQPAGPYQLAGFSFGGRVALEMGQQLRAAGESVSLVAAVDTFMAGAVRRRPLLWAAFHLKNVVARGPRYLAELARRRWGVAAMDAGDELIRIKEREVAYRARSRAKHHPRPYDGKIVLFRARDNNFPKRLRVEPLLGWNRLARGELVVADVSGRHDDLPRSPAVDEIAKLLRPHLIGNGSAAATGFQGTQGVSGNAEFVEKSLQLRQGEMVRTADPTTLR